MDRSSRQEANTTDFKWHQEKLIDVYKTIHPNAAEYAVYTETSMTGEYWTTKQVSLNLNISTMWD